MTREEAAGKIHAAYLLCKEAFDPGAPWRHDTMEFEEEEEGLFYARVNDFFLRREMEKAIRENPDQIYKSVIVFCRELGEEKLRELKSAADRAFDNRAGKAVNISSDPYMLVYAGGESLYGCLDLGNLALLKTEGFLEAVTAFRWIDEEDPDECCDILEELA